MAVFPAQAELFAAQRTPTVVHFQVVWDDAAAAASKTFTIPVKAGTFVHYVGTYVTTAFNTSGANAALIVGDGDNDDGFLESGDTIIQTLDTAANSLANGAAYEKGKFYVVDDTIDVKFTAAASGASAGCVKGFVVMSLAPFDGVPASATGVTTPVAV